MAENKKKKKERKGHVFGDESEKHSDTNIAKMPKRKVNNQAKRQWKHDKCWSMEKKKKMKEKNYFKRHDDVSESHIPDGFVANKSPHIAVNHWYHRI